MNQDELIKRIEELEEEIIELRKVITKKGAYTEEEALEHLRDEFISTSEKFNKYDLTILTKDGEIYGCGGNSLKSHTWTFFTTEASREDIVYFQIVDFKNKVVYYSKDKDVINGMVERIIN